MESDEQKKNNRKKIMTITLITGSAGSLGSEIYRQLEENNIKGDKPFSSVYGLDKNDGFRVDFVVDLVKETEKLEQVFSDIRPNHVIHCAANIYGVAGFNELPATILGDDVTMLKNVLDNFVKIPKELRGRFVYISSSMVYEQVKGNPELTEELVDLAPAPKTEYGLSKFTGERLVVAYAKQYELNYTIWRPFNIITPYERPGIHKEGGHGYSHVFADFFENILMKKLNPLPIFGDGNQIRCFTWYEEVAECIVSNFHNKLTNSKIYNIGNNEPITMLQLANMIVNESIKRGLLPKDYQLNFKTVKNWPNDVQVRVPNVMKALGELGFFAQIKTQESISRCMDEWETYV